MHRDAASELVRRLRRVPTRDRLRFDLRLGEMVADAYYANDHAAFRRRWRRDPRVRALGAHPHLPCSNSALRRALQLHAEVSVRPYLVSYLRRGLVTRTQVHLILSISPGAGRDTFDRLRRYPTRVLERQSRDRRSDDHAASRSSARVSGRRAAS
jgi:hypothetical protein